MLSGIRSVAHAHVSVKQNIASSCQPFRILNNDSGGGSFVICNLPESAQTSRNGLEFEIVLFYNC